jgi:hypothetical protein
VQVKVLWFMGRSFNINLTKAGTSKALKEIENLGLSNNWGQNGTDIYL